MFLSIAVIYLFVVMLHPSNAFTFSARAFQGRSLTRLFSSLSLYIETPDDMHDLGALLSQIATQRGDVLLLDGDLGAGKTCLSRGFVQTLVGDEQRVTSPTYLLCNSYPIGQSNGNGAPQKVNHMDLYRLSGQEQDLVPLNLDKAFAEDVSLIEWPQRLGDKIPTKRLELNLQIVDTEDDIESDGDCQPRLVALTPIGKEWEDRLEMLQAEGYVDDWIISDNE